MPAQARVFSSPRWRTLAVVLVSFITATLITAGASIYLPFGEIDSIGVPILMFPITWTALVLFSALRNPLWQVWAVLGALSVLHVALIFRHLGG